VWFPSRRTSLEGFGKKNPLAWMRSAAEIPLFADPLGFSWIIQQFVIGKKFKIILRPLHSGRPPLNIFLA
jgi:hypothetical protein